MVAKITVTELYKNTRILAIYHNTIQLPTNSFQLFLYVYYFYCVEPTCYLYILGETESKSRHPADWVILQGPRLPTCETTLYRANEIQFHLYVKV